MDAAQDIPTNLELEVLKAQYDAQGFAVARALFSPEEVEFLREHYMELRARGSHPGDMVAETELKQAVDPLKKFPRMIHMHRWDEVSKSFLLDARLNAVLSALLGREPFAVQSMLYFKPPGARGQALHQDNFYLQTRPGTCMAAWLALDDCDEENGCMQLVPASHQWPVLCPAKADSSQSFTNVSVPLPPGASPEPVLMEAGDCLFFNGTLVHGSFPNASADRFRRSLIGHYVEGDTTELTRFDQPVLTMDGEEMWLGASEGGGECGVWVERDGSHRVEMSAHKQQAEAHG